MVALLMILAGFAVLVVGCWWLCNIALNPKEMTETEARQVELERAGLTEADFAAWEKQSFTLQSRYNYQLYGEVYPAPKHPQNTLARVVVLVHGHAANHYAMLSFAAMFRELGFDVIAYDQRNYGRSAHKPTTMGAYEADDLETVCAWARKRYGADCILGTHGVSMGAATVMLHSARDHNLAFVVEDCGYCDLEAQLQAVIKNFLHLPACLLAPCYVLIKLRTGVWFPDIKPAQAVSNSGKVPMLFVHGAKDSFVPFAMLEQNYAAKTSGLRCKQAFENAGHAQALGSDRALYHRTVQDFLQQIGI